MIIVSARCEVEDRILGLHSGADDYLVKPYDVGELVARVHAVYRRRRAGERAEGDPPEVVELDEVAIDLHRQTVTVDGGQVTLTRKEFQVLALLASSGGAVCTRNRIVAEVWGRSWAGANRTLDVHIATLRTKLGRSEAGADRARRRLPARLPDPGGVRCAPGCWSIVLVLLGAARGRAWACRWRCPTRGPASCSCSPTGSPTPSTSPRWPAARSPSRTWSGCTPSWPATTRCTGSAVLVLDPQKRLLVASRQPPPTLDGGGSERVDKALVNRRSAAYPLLMPWDRRPVVLAEPVLVDERVLGAVVTISPTDQLRAAELRVWTAVLAAALLALAAGVLVALPIVRWILRPVRRLDEGTGRVAAAVLAGARPDPVADGTGPPELRRLSESFDRMAETVTQAYAAQRAFVADASHQLRNPLTALQPAAVQPGGARAAGRGRGARGGAGGGAAADHPAGRPARAGPRRAHAAAGHGGRGHRADGPDRGLAARWSRHSDLQLVVQGERGLAVLAPEHALEMVLDELLDNAIKFCPPGGPDRGAHLGVADRGARSRCATPGPG